MRASGRPGTALSGERGGLTWVDRSGDPDDLVDAAEAARMMGYSGRAVIHGNVWLGYFPAPDADEAGGQSNCPSDGTRWVTG